MIVLNNLTWFYIYATLLGMTETLHITPWADTLLDTLGHDPRSWYVETFWLPTIGPTCLLLARRIADGFDRNPDGFVVAFESLSVSLGLGEPPSPGNGPLKRAIQRLERFSIASLDTHGVLLAHRRFPPIHRKHLHRLPTSVRAIDHEIHEAELARPMPEIAESNARRIALRFVAAHESPDCIERTLLRSGYTPRIARDAAMWATRALAQTANLQ